MRNLQKKRTSDKSPETARYRTETSCIRIGERHRGDIAGGIENNIRNAA
jgi:hypothetical protein